MAGRYRKNSRFYEEGEPIERPIERPNLTPRKPKMIVLEDELTDRVRRLNIGNHCECDDSPIKCQQHMQTISPP